MAMEMNGKAFYNAWSPAYEMSGKWVRDYLLTGDGYSDSDKIGRFIMELPRSVPPDQYLFLEVKYQDTNAFSVPVFIGSPNKIDVGFLKNSGSQEWKIEQLGRLSDAAAKAQDYLCGLAVRYQKLAERVTITGSEKFSWIYDREIQLVRGL